MKWLRRLKDDTKYKTQCPKLPLGMELRISFKKRIRYIKGAIPKEPHKIMWHIHDISAYDT